MELEKVNTQFNKNLLDYENREKNVLISSEENPMALYRYFKNGKEYTETRCGMYAVAAGPNYIKQRKKIEELHIACDEIREIKAGEETAGKKKKSTGGQPAYVMLMTKEKNKIKGLSCEAISILTHMCLEGIQWNTGKLMQERSKKPHTSESIAKTIDKGIRTTKSALKELSEHDIIKYDKKNKFYFMSADIARKGAVQENED